MKRARSVLTLKNMAESLQQSIQQSVKQQLARQTSLSHARSTLQLPTRPPHEAALNKQQKDNRIFILQKQIACIERELQNSKSTIRNYSKELDDYELLSARISNLREKMTLRQEQFQRVRNQMLMLQEEIGSIAFNEQEMIAERQYYEQLIDTYRAQYPAESECLMGILQLQENNKQIGEQMQETERKIERNKQELQTWKQETEFDLNQHKLRNSIKIIRVELIAQEDKCDAFCQQHNLRKMRELYCLFFKNYAKRNGIHTEAAEGGIDLFICKQGLVDEFNEFVQERLVFNKPHCQNIQDYLNGLAKMEEIFRKNNSIFNNKLHNVQIEEINQLQLQLQGKGQQVQINKQKIAQLQSKIEQQFGQDSLAVIEYLREKSNKYDIQQIKSTLKEQKRQQEVRIKKIKQAWSTLAHLQRIVAQGCATSMRKTNREAAYELQEQMLALQAEISKIQSDLSQLDRDKADLQNLINLAISKWRERDQNKLKLKQLYQERSETKKQSSKGLAQNRSISFKELPNTKREPGGNECALTDSRQTGHHSKNSSITSLNHSKSILSLNNPYEKIMRRQIDQYEPIISNCQMILSKKLPSRQESKELLATKKEAKVLTISQLKQSRADSINMKKTKTTNLKSKNKENQFWDTRTKCQSQTQAKSSFSMKPNLAPSMQGSKGKLSSSERASLSKLLINKFNR